MELSLKQFTKAIAAAKNVATYEPVAEFIQLKAESTRLWVGSRSAAMSYDKAIPYTGDASFRTIYIPVDVANVLPKTTKDDVLTLTYNDGDLVFESSIEQGRVAVVTGMQFAAPYHRIDVAHPLVVLRDGMWLKDAITLVKSVKKGWKVSNRPYSAGFIQLMAQEDTEHHAPDVCRLLLDCVTHDQDRAIDYVSSLALSVFASDTLRYFEVFEPLVTAEPQDFKETLPVSTIFNDRWMGQPFHVAISDAERFVKCLDGAEYRVGVILNMDKVPDALVFMSVDSVLWLRLSLSTYPTDDFNKQLAFFKGGTLATFTPTTAFISTLKSAEKLSTTREHGLTVMVESGKVVASSPEHATTVRYSSNDAVTNVTEPVKLIVDGSGFLASIKPKQQVTLIAGDDFLAVYNSEEKYRVILKQFMR